MNTYIFAVIIAAVVLLLSAIVSTSISYKPDNSDPKSRKIWFWIFAVINPVIFFALASTVLVPDKKADQQDWNDSLPIALAVGFVLYIVLGFVLSKMFRNKKLGNWF